MIEIKKMRIQFIVVLVLLAWETQAQRDSGPPPTGIPGTGFYVNVGANGSNNFVTESQGVSSETKGGVYFDSAWSVADITLNTKAKIAGSIAKLNLETNALEINYKGQIKILPASKIYSFSWRNATSNDTVTFVNGHQYKLNGTPIEGFFEIKQTGNWSLLSKPNLVTVKSTYVAPLDAGNPNTKLVKREEFYLMNQSILMKTDLSKKKFLSQFSSELQSGIKQFLESEKIGTKKIEDLILLTEYLNTSKD